jgi:hypothetical protein
MSEIVALAAVGGAIAAGVGFGTKYINDLFRLERVRLDANQPLVRPKHPSGEDWAEQEKT